MSKYEGSERRATVGVSRTQFNWGAMAIIVTLGLAAVGGAVAYGQQSGNVEANATNIDRLEDMIHRENAGESAYRTRIENILMQQHGQISAQTQAIKTLTEEIRASRARD